MIFRNIVSGVLPPQTSDIWMDDKTLKYFGPKGWTAINNEFNASELYDAAFTGEVLSDQFEKKLIKAIEENRTIYVAAKNERNEQFKAILAFADFTPDRRLFLDAVNYHGRYRFILNLNTNLVTFESARVASEAAPTAELFDMYTFNLSEDGKDINIKNASEIPFDKIESVRVKGIKNGEEYNTIGIYHNGHITALQDSKQVVFNVDFNTGEIDLLSLVDVAKVLPYITLQLGNDESVKQFNLEHIKTGSFFVSIGVGYGVGDYNPTDGGCIHIVTSKGYDVFYDISADGAIIKNNKYIKPNEPYTVQLTAEQMNKSVDEVLGSRLMDAGEIVIDGITGPITYTRAADSTDRMVYFTDDRKDGKMSIITYNVNNRTLLHVDTFVPVGPATDMALGGIMKGGRIENATSETLVQQFNALLEELRVIGVIER